MSLPFCLFLYNPFSLDRDDPHLVIDSLEGMSNLKKIKEYIYKTLSTKDNPQIEYQPCLEDESHASIIQNQKEELRKLEQEEVAKFNKNKFEDKQQEKKVDKKPMIKSKNLPPEPDINSDQSSLILFRFPDGHGRVERRFHKTNTICDLYTFVESLENQNFNKEGQYELVQTFPYKVFNQKEKSLEDEKLFPNAVIQIKEID
jgi:hypothetical protein